jgi:hypothetical protein
VGHRVIDTPEHTFTLQGGLGYTTERYGTAQTIANETPASTSGSAVPERSGASLRGARRLGSQLAHRHTA